MYVSMYVSDVSLCGMWMDCRETRPIFSGYFLFSFFFLGLTGYVSLCSIAHCSSNPYIVADFFCIDFLNTCLDNGMGNKNLETLSGKSVVLCFYPGDGLEHDSLIP